MEPLESEIAGGLDANLAFDRRPRLEEAVSVSVPTRLARTVLQLLDEQSSRSSKLKIKQYELAQIVRAPRETVNKHLRTWAKRKWIRPERASIVVVDSSALAAIALGGAGDGRRSSRAD
jgi:hypothetical protein